MIETFLSGGVIMWPLLAIAIGVGAMVIRALAVRGDRGAEELQARRTAILFWGGMAAMLGLLGTVVGLVQMAQQIQRAGSAAPQLVWGGVAVTLVSLVFGILVLLLAGFAWLGLQRLDARGRGSDPAA